MNGFCGFDWGLDYVRAWFRLQVCKPTACLRICLRTVDLSGKLEAHVLSCLFVSLRARGEGDSFALASMQRRCLFSSVNDVTCLLALSNVGCDTHARTHTHTHTYTRMHTRTYTRMHTHTARHTCTLTQLATHARARTHIAHSHTRHTYARTHTHTPKDIRIHTATRAIAALRQ